MMSPLTTDALPFGHDLLQLVRKVMGLAPSTQRGCRLLPA
jgi:hypothetical protein